MTPATVLSICPVRGCGELTTGGRCEVHQAEYSKRDNRRRHAKQREHGRDSAHWRVLRLRRLELDAYRCQLRVDTGCSRRATTVHLDPRMNGDHLAASIADVTSCCAHCHGVVDGQRSTGGWASASDASVPPRAQAPARNVHHRRQGGQR